MTSECPICFEHLEIVGDCCDVCKYAWCKNCKITELFDNCPFCRSQLTRTHTSKSPIKRKKYIFFFSCLPFSVWSGMMR